ncbi:MAG: hypothetical protein NC483_05375 [Ruminococcus sp.]|nr:hypothetical protein [Ruminococcus sp.]
MTDVQILDIFYNKIAPEAQQGKIDCYITINMVFNLIIDNKEISRCENLSYDGLLIPTLKITNKELFDKLLIEYVRKALVFYDAREFAFLDVLDRANPELIPMKEEYLIKYIISTLFANASFSDFDGPLEFLSSRIAMFDNRILNCEEELELGYIESIKARLFAVEESSPIRSETPYRIKSYLQFDDGYKLLLPEIYAGNDNKKYKLYGIQKTTKTNEIEERSYLKQIRKGFIAKINGAPEHYFLAVMLFLSLCSDKDIEVILLLVERWNAKRIAMCDRAKRNNNIPLDDIEKEQDMIQNNITNIFLRYFTKLEDITNGINFTSIPFESSDNLNINISQNLESRSVAFNELFKIVNEYKSQNNSLGR